MTRAEFNIVRSYARAILGARNPEEAKPAIDGIRKLASPTNHDVPENRPAAQHPTPSLPSPPSPAQATTPHAQPPETRTDRDADSLPQTPEMGVAQNRLSSWPAIARYLGVLPASDAR